MNFMEEARRETNVAYTENGALSHESTLNAVLDFFSKSGAMRGNQEMFDKYFLSALDENPELAMKALFYSRDVRGGQGERDTFRNELFTLGAYYPHLIENNIELIPYYGRWDDLFALFGTTIENKVMMFIDSQIRADIISESPSLLGKWLPSENASSNRSKALARRIANSINLSYREYRKIVSLLRKKINIVESKMSAKMWDKIDYEKVPSQAMRIYRGAFGKHDEDRFNEFLSAVENGDKKINASTLYPYEIVRRLMTRGYDRTLEAQWNALPDYMNGENAIAVVDTSGSMTMGGNDVLPIHVALSLGIYFAERSKGKFKDYFITFSQRPKVQKLSGDTLYRKIVNLSQANWEMNTDLIAVFEALLETAKRISATKEDMPTKIYIISDMQFDVACGSRTKTNFRVIDDMYKEAGYKRPELVFWNVNGYSDSPVEKDETGTYLVSGCSPSILKYAMNVEEATPEKLMLDVLNSERYSLIKV